MNRVFTKNSSHVQLFAYDAKTKILEVGFSNGHTYHYHKVPQSIFEEMKSAPSVGKFVHDRLADFKYEHKGKKP